MRTMVKQYQPSPIDWWNQHRHVRYDHMLCLYRKYFHEQNVTLRKKYSDEEIHCKCNIRGDSLFYLGLVEPVDHT